MQKVYYNRLLEVACFNVESCILAQEAGADRIEFCSDYSAGGLTPRYEDIIKVKEKLHIPLHVIIRPRSGDFEYSKNEIEIIKNDILFCKENHIDGVVFGVLDNAQKIFLEINKDLFELAGAMSTTFHRAIDQSNNFDEAMDTLISIGFSRVLTSGNMQNASEGIQTLKKTQDKLGQQIIIIPGGGIRSSNIEQIIKQTNCIEYHTAAITDFSEKVNPDEIKKLKEILRNK